MQLLFVAPFLFAAALAFTILAAIPPWRRWAIPIPTGILGSAPCLFAVFGGEMLVTHWLGHDPGPGRKAILAYLCVAIVAGILGGIAAGMVARLLTGILPRILLRSAILIAAGCSYFVLLVAMSLAAAWYWRLPDSNISWIVEAVLVFIGAWFTAGNPEPFRSSNFRLPVGMGFRQRGRQPLAGK
jgi:hypothetical protein